METIKKMSFPRFSNRFSVVPFVVEEIKTCTVHVYHKSVFKLKYIQKNLPQALKRFVSVNENLNSCTFRLTNMHLLNKFFHKVFHMSRPVVFDVISHFKRFFTTYFVLLDMFVVCSCMNYVLQKKDFCPKCFIF